MICEVGVYHVINVNYVANLGVGRFLVIFGTNSQGQVYHVYFVEDLGIVYWDGVDIVISYGPWLLYQMFRGDFRVQVFVLRLAVVSFLFRDVGANLRTFRVRREVCEGSDVLGRLLVGGRSVAFRMWQGNVCFSIFYGDVHYSFWYILRGVRVEGVFGGVSMVFRIQGAACEGSY